MHSGEKETISQKQNRYLPLSESVTACAAHPFTGTIVAGTKVQIVLYLVMEKLGPFDIRCSSD